MANEIKTRQRVRSQRSGELVPVTLRIPSQDRDHFEHMARLHGYKLSEYLRALLDEYATTSSFGHRLDDIGAGLNALSERVQQSLGKEHSLREISKQLDATTKSVEQFTTLIQSSFEQLFEAFFKLQTFIEHSAKVQGGRR